MLLIDVTLRPGFVLSRFERRTEPMVSTRIFMRRTFGPMLVRVFASIAWLGLLLDNQVSEQGAQVRFHDSDAYDINVPDLSIKVQIQGVYPGGIAERLNVRDEAFGAVTALFRHHRLEVPNNFNLEVIWEPSHGCRMLGGVYYEW